MSRFICRWAVCLVGVGLLVLCAVGAGAGQPAPNTQPAVEASTQPAEEPRRPGAVVEERLERAAETLRMLNRIRDLEWTVSELARHLGGPSRDLTVRPDDDLNTVIERMDRADQSLRDELRRLRRDMEELRRRVDRLERRG